jgi:hypothetical protein
MKKIVFFACLLLAASIYGCKDDVVGQPPTDSVAPAPITNPHAESLPGGAKISYDLPDDDDFLYVKAVYFINGVEKKTTATLYSKSLEVRGFGTTDPQTILLYSVDRSKNHSAPVEVTIHPDTAPVQLILQSMSMQRDFGGVLLTWKNEHKADVVIYVLAADSTGEVGIAEEVYTSSADGKFNLRGFDSTERVFGVQIRDRWDNYSNTLMGTYTPLYEMKLDKLLWKRQSLPGDNNTQYDDGGWAWIRLYDDMIGNQGWHTGQGQSPMYFTIDLGVTVKLSRYTLWHRLEGWEYTHHNPRKWKVYGSDSPNFSETSSAYWIDGGFTNDWYLLADCVSFKPSGDSNPVTQEDRDYANEGFGFELPSDAPPVRYVRFHVAETWGGGDNLHISEISLWGQEVR